MRTRIVEELSADLHDMARELVARGVPVEEAERRALDRLLPTPDTVDRLSACHRTFYQRLADRFSDPARHRFERVLFGLSLLLLAVIGAAALGSADLLRDPTIATLPLLGLSLATLGIVLRKLFQLHVRKDHVMSRLRRGLAWLPALAIGSAVGTLLGLTTELYAVSGRMAELSDATAMPGDVRAILLPWLRRNAAMASIGLLAGGLSLGSWLWLTAGCARVAQAEQELETSIET
ncbi:MAG: hypothetical protein ACODAA_09405 [Gemmatimonadota bacterium]